MPVFAVNFGEIGFLATLDPDGSMIALRQRVRGRLRAARASGDRGRRTEGIWTAMNDISVPPQAGSRVADLALRRCGDEIGRVRCDGLVVSTPAGSTGYNLANGGPVLAWGVEGYVVSFIAPHSLTARALVVAPHDLLTIDNSLPRGSGRGERRRPAGLASSYPGEDLRVELRAARATAGAAAGRDLLSPPAGEFGRLAH